jgi:hypothetical protein
MTIPRSDDALDSLDKIAPRTCSGQRSRRLSSGTLNVACRVGLANSASVGAFVAEALVLGESVMLDIRLPDKGKQVIPAKIVRALGTEYGFQFTSLNAAQRGQIRATLKERPAIPYDHGENDLGVETYGDYSDLAVIAVETKATFVKSEALFIVACSAARVIEGLSSFRDKFSIITRRVNCQFQNSERYSPDEPHCWGSWAMRRKWPSPASVPPHSLSRSSRCTLPLVVLVLADGDWLHYRGNVVAGR